MTKVTVFLVLLVFSGTVIAQDGRSLVTMIESESKEKAPEWNLERKSANERHVMMLWRADEGLVRLIIMIADSARQARAWSKRDHPVTKTKNGARRSETELSGFGSDAFLAKDLEKKDWMVLGFRRGRVFVQVYAAAETTVKMFAEIVDRQISGQPNKRSQLTAR